MDREKIIKNLEFCVNGHFKVELSLATKILALLKEQEAVEPLFNERMKHFVCPNCSLVLDEGRDDYCPSCGKRIAWTEYYIHEDKTEDQ